MCYNIVWGGQVLYIIPREARREPPSREVYNLFACEARVYPSSIGQQWQGQRDFILAISLSSLVGVCLDVIQSSDVKVHYGFPGNRLPSMTKLRVLFMKRVFSYVNYNNVYGRWITTQYLRQIKENSKLNNGGFNKWLEILAGKDLQTKLRKSEDVDFKFSASNGTAKANTVN